LRVAPNCSYGERRDGHSLPGLFPPGEPHSLAQNEAFFYLETAEGSRRIRFHDYADIFRFPGLYEQIFFDRLKCSSPHKVAELLRFSAAKAGAAFNELRVLDVGAGNGMVGAELATHGVARLVGLDIVPEARDAAERDHPGVYDAYCVTDLTQMSAETEEELREWRINAMTCVAALGFGDIPTTAFRQAFNLIEPGGWIAFNIKETFLGERDETGFSALIKESLLQGWLDLHHLERYRHRISMDGAALYYFAIVGRKAGPIPASAAHA
jgi:SAM-dependent methyltransferase